MIISAHKRKYSTAFPGRLFTYKKLSIITVGSATGLSIPYELANFGLKLKSKGNIGYGSSVF